MEEKIYDLIIIGAGPAGLTASIYAQRAGLNTLVLEKLSPGGQILLSEKIENYPGFSQPIFPQKLMEEMQKQAENLGMRLEQGEVEKIGIENNKKIVYTKSGEKYNALSLIIASGCSQRKLGVQGEEKFIGRGVSYCATCDAPFFKEKKVAVVGGSNTAAEEALYLTKFVDKVYLIHRRGMLRAEKILQERISKNPKIEIVWKSVIERIYGEKEVKGVKIKNVDTEEIKDLSCSGVFIFVGLEPNTHFLRNMVKLDEIGFVNTNNNLQTDKKGIFACGDVRKNTLKQVIVACGEGALAAYSAQKYINNIKGIEYN
ncbi:thioredoxin-disulfide reductase [Candidatus Aerophobetes bacterium]|nr:thioredoxin-disulfide reductase [Candidatus Aerophobetes bacterium]